MTTQEIINNILNAKSYVDVFPNLSNWQTTFKEYIKQLHPDICKLSGSAEATSMLLNFKKELERGKSHQDDAGDIIYFVDKIILKGDIDLLNKSLKNYNILKKLAKGNHFDKYLPKEMLIINNEIQINLEHRAIPLSSIDFLPQEHVNWILSRILEISSWFYKNNYSHSGLNPDSIYVVPETHGIIIISYYHLAEIGKKLNTVSGRYINFYPNFIFTEKKASYYIDVELAKRTAAYLLGDKSGNGSGLRKKFNLDFIDFLLKFHTKDTFSVFKEYRKMLEKNFEKKFHPLNI
jgi:hypothetical protein